MITPSFNLTATERVLPKLALDFTTASLDARVTFTRTTNATNPATYINSSGYITAATNNEPRFDYDPITLVCKGLLIEESRANKCPYSQDISSWTQFGSGSVTADAETAPDNTLTADLVETTVTTGSNFRFMSVSFTGNGEKVVSLFLKPASDGTNYILLRDETVPANRKGISVTWASGVPTVANVVGTGTIYPAQQYSNGWYRFSFSAANVVAGNTNRIRIYPSIDNIVSEKVYAWGVQAEDASFPTSYIPTTTTALTRNADVATMTGTNFSDWYNATEGTLVAQALIPQVVQSSALFCVSDGTSAERIQLRKSTTQVVGVVVDNNSSQASITAGTWTSTTAAQVGTLGYKVNSFACATNGSTLGTDTSGTIPTVTQAEIGFGQASTYANGWIQKLSYYPQRLTDAEIRAFSK